ncbi:MAG: amino acid ABC transporter permease [bacterium]
MEYSIQNLQFLLDGALVTIELWLVSVIFSFIFAVPVAIVRNNKTPVLGKVLTIFTNIIRGTPLMLQLYTVYFAIPILLGMGMGSFLSASIAMIISGTAYMNEIIRVGIRSVEKWQYDAAQALGLNYWQTMLYIVLPQAFSRSVAGIGNEIVSRLYSIPLIAVLGMDELLKNAKVIVVRTFDFTPFLIIAIFYYLFNTLILKIVNSYEKRLTKFKLAENQ